MWSVGKKLLDIYNGSVAPPEDGPNHDPDADVSNRLAALSTATTGNDVKLELTNLGGVGSEEDARLREEAANHESEFAEAGQATGIEVWRIEKFQPQRLEVRGENISLFSGDSYIVLRTTVKEGSDSFDWQLHYWIGKDSTQDEYAAAAYYAVNIDDLLSGKPVQHRELQYSESALFHSYFKSVTYLDGGIDSGFSKAQPDTYKPRLLQMKSAGGTVRVLQVPLRNSSLNNADVFILDNGMTIYQFNSSNSAIMERIRAARIVNEDILAERNFEPELVLLDGDEVFTNEPFWQVLGGKLDELPSTSQRLDDELSDDVDFSAPKSLLRISNETGELVLSLVKKDDSLSSEDVDEHDVWAVACDKRCFIYIGDAATKDEKFCVWNRCHAILAALSLDSDAPVTFFSRESDADIWNQLFQ